MSMVQQKNYIPVVQMTPHEHRGAVKDIFSSITGEYDFLNHFLSLRRDVAWRRFTARKMSFFQTFRFLDLATGTADVAVEVAQRFPDVQVTGIDLVQEMLEVGRIKVAKKKLQKRIKLMQGDVLNLSFPDDSFDAVSIAFGLRNIPDKRRAIAEMQRVVVPGGQVMILEMTMPRQGSIFRNIYSIYLNKMLPYLARFFSRNPAAYKYLADSISGFLSPEELAELMISAGLEKVDKYPLSCGLTYLHIGYKMKN